jgi:hypothetical protein
MENDKRNKDEYPKLSEDDKRWKQQDEFDSAGAQRQLEDEYANASIAESSSDAVEGNEGNTSDAYSTKTAENTRKDREQP